MNSDFLARLQRLDACAVSDALDQLGLTPSVTGLISLGAPSRIFGRVATVKLVAGKAPADAPAQHLCTAAIDAAQPGDVVVVEHRSGVECAGWGGILSNAARVKGISGVIVEGFARDLDEAAQIGFAVFARSATARTARGRVFEAATNEPIEVGGTTVAAGDYVVADRSGAAFIPAAQIADVLAAAERIAAREAALTKMVLSGEPVTTVMGANYETMLNPAENTKHD